MKVSAKDSFLTYGCINTYRDDIETPPYSPDEAIDMEPEYFFKVLKYEVKNKSYEEPCDVSIRSKEGPINDIASQMAKTNFPAFNLFRFIINCGNIIEEPVYNPGNPTKKMKLDCLKINSFETICTLPVYEGRINFILRKYTHSFLLERIECEGH